ncbi:MAG: hypothetical protein KZQ60_05815 [Candidatus Thiodiazotropha sp. (ex Lucinoma aequizonata)]|nr:hypothetical protein [Candidatus Thiodiazotropha sp. (ex Lucinoma aequizonata)]
MHYSIMTTAMTLQRLRCALCMPFISPFRSPFRPYNHAYAYRGLTAFAPLSMAISGCRYSIIKIVLPISTGKTTTLILQLIVPERFFTMLDLLRGFILN